MTTKKHEPWDFSESNLASGDEASCVNKLVSWLVKTQRANFNSRVEIVNKPTNWFVEIMHQLI